MKDLISATAVLVAFVSGFLIGMDVAGVHCIRDVGPLVAKRLRNHGKPATVADTDKLREAVAEMSKATNDLGKTVRESRELRSRRHEGL